MVLERPEIGEATITRPRRRSRECGRTSSNRRENAQRSARRARSSIRRYSERNHLTKRATVTFPDGHDRHDHAKVMRDASRFIAILRSRFGGFPYLYSAEPHPRRGGLHVNVLLPEWIPDIFVRIAWAKAIGDSPFGLQVDVQNDGNRNLQNRAAAQASYIAKDAEGFFGRDLDVEEAELWDDIDVPPRSHFYEVGQGFFPRVVRRVFASVGAALTWCRKTLGDGLSIVATSVGRSWRGPAFVMLRRQ